MKTSKYLKITAYILIQLFLTANFVWAADDIGMGADCLHTLAPALQINSNIYFPQYYTFDVVKPWDKVDVVLKEQKKIIDSFTNTIEVSFRNDHVGIFSEIINAISEDGELIWFEMGKDKDRKTFKFGVSTKTKKQRSIIIDKIKNIDDLPNNKHKEIKKKKWVLTITAEEKGEALKNITSYLASLYINVSEFLTPKSLKDGQSQLVFELDIPRFFKIDMLKSKLSLFTNSTPANVQITAGQLTDRILDEFLIKELSVEIGKEGRKDLRSALKIVAARHISQARKDRRTPFVMHPVEIAKIISNEIKMFTPELLLYFSRALKMKKDKVILSILMATLLHDAVEDGDILQEKVYANFGKLISEIVRMVSKTSDQRDKKGETVYLNDLVKRKDTVGLIAQIVKIADRIHNLRTLRHNSPEFQRKIVFSTIDNFTPFFISRINVDEIKNKYMRDLFIRTIRMFNHQMLRTLNELNFLDEIGTIYPEQRKQYEWEEKCRLNPKVLRLAEKNNIIAHGVISEKGGRASLLGIIKQGYIKAKPTEVGMTVFAGLLRPQRSGEDYDDYQAESPGPFGPYYVLLDPIVNNLRLTKVFAKRKVILPGFYQGRLIDGVNYGIKDDFHLAYLVPANTDRQYIADKLSKLVQNNELDMNIAWEAISKIITYDEFLALKGSLNQKNMFKIKTAAKSFFTSHFIEHSI